MRCRPRSSCLGPGLGLALVAFVSAYETRSRDRGLLPTARGAVEFVQSHLNPSLRIMGVLYSRVTFGYGRAYKDIPRQCENSAGRKCWHSGEDAYDFFFLKGQNQNRFICPCITFTLVSYKQSILLALNTTKTASTMC